MAERVGDEMDRKKKKRKKKEKEKRNGQVGESSSSSESESRDPLLVLGADVVMKVMEFLDARSVARLLVVSREWHQIAISDRIWAPKCEELLRGKAHIPRLSQVRGASKLVSYSLSVMDGKRFALLQWIFM